MMRKKTFTRIIILMFKYSVILFFSLVTSVSFAKPCIYNGSCFKLNNQYNQSAKIVCYSKLSGRFLVEAQGNSEGSIQFDISLNDGMGYPEPDKLRCDISFTTNGTKHSFDFDNPFWGPTIEFTVLSNRKISLVAYDKWSSEQKRVDFHW